MWYSDLDDVLTKLCNKLAQCNIKKVDKDNLSKYLMKRLHRSFENQRKKGHKAMYCHVDFKSVEHVEFESHKPTRKHLTGILNSPRGQIHSQETDSVQTHDI